EQLGELMLVNALPPASVMNLAINQMRIDFKKLIQDTPYNTMDLQIGDIVMAAWVSGVLSTESIHYMLSTAGLTESHPSGWSNALNCGRGVGQGHLVYIPGVGQIPAVALQIVLTAVQSSQALQKEASDEVQLIRVNGG